MSSDDSKQLAKAVKAQHARDNREDVTDKVVDEIKHSMIFQYNWEELLQSGPVALTCLGSCFIATASNTSQGLTLEPPRNGFQFLQQTSLDANLVDNINHGYHSFLVAETNMAFVKDVSKKVYNRVADVMDTLMDPETAKTQLAPQLKTIKIGADDCYKKAKEVDAQFETWLNHAMELHAACVQTESSAEERLHATELNMAVAQSRFVGAKDAVKFSKEAADKFGKQVELASDAYKQASDKFPSGWDILGQQVVGALADTVTTALGQVVSGLANNLNPVARAEAGVGMFRDLIHGGKHEETDKDVATPKAPPARKSTAPQHSTDPAYATIKTAILHFSLINAVVNGKDGGIDWEMASGADGASDKSIFVALELLKDAQASFAKVATSEEPSETLKSSMAAAIKVATEVQSEVTKSKGTSHKFPDAASETVKAWQKSFDDAYGKANKLAAIARALPGSSGGAPIMSNTDEDPDVTIAKTNAKSAQAQAVLESAKNRLTTTQQHLKDTQELYLQASKELLEQQNKLTEIQGEVTRLGETKLGLVEIKKVLIHCIELMVQLKQQIMNLCRFFAAVSGSIEAVVNYTVTPFIESINSATGGDGSRKVGNYTLTDLTRSIIYQAAISVRAYFSVFGDIATMWVTLSTDNIMPGLKMVEEMMLNRGDIAATQQKVAKLKQWSTKAQQAVKDIAAKERETILSTMQERVDEIQDVTKALPPTPQAQKAIEEGTKEVREVASDATKDNAANAPIRRFGMKRQ
jgi:hypothetical protein